MTLAVTRRTPRRLGSGVVAGVVALGLSAAALPGYAAESGASVAPGQAGRVVNWGTNSSPVPEAPAGEPVVDLALGQLTAMAVTGNGKLVVWGSNPNLVGAAVPEELANKTITDVALSTGPTAAVVTDAGTVETWGLSGFTSPAPEDLTDVVDVSADLTSVLALKSNGTVVVFGPGNSYGDLDVPEGLSGVAAITSGGRHHLALKRDGSVVTWGYGGLGVGTIPETLTGKQVVDIAAGQSHSLALTSEGEIVGWGRNTKGQTTVPAELTGDGAPKVVAINAYSDNSMALTEDGQVFVWGTDSAGDFAVPESLAGQPVAALAAGQGQYGVIVSSMQATGKPAVTGTAKVGETLTADATQVGFTQEPESTTTQWRADGEPIADATGESLELTDAMVGKRITYAVIATKGEDTAMAESTPTAPVAGLVTASTTSVSVSRATSTWGKAHAITVRVAATGATPTGTVSVKAGPLRKNARVNSNGVATVAVPKNLKVGNYAVSASYAGNDAVSASKGTARLRITKARMRLTEAFAARIKKRVRARGVVRAKVVGTTLKRAGVVKVMRGKRVVGKGKLRNGKVRIRLVKLPKGKNKLVLRLSGNRNTKAATKRFVIRVR